MQFSFGDTWNLNFKNTRLSQLNYEVIYEVQPCPTEFSTFDSYFDRNFLSLNGVSSTIQAVIY